MPTTSSTAIVTGSFEKYNRGPITTLFQPPTTCYRTLTSTATAGQLFAGHYQKDFFDPACYPHGTLGASQLTSFSSWRQYFYSPAICPSDWTTATQYTSTLLGYGDDLKPSALSLGNDTSAYLCCPTSFTYQKDHICTSVPIVGTHITFSYITQQGTTQTAIPSELLVSTASLVVSCDGIPIWQQATDAAVLSAASTMRSSNTATSTQPPLTPSPSLPPSTPSVSPGGISTGAKAAIGVAIPVVFLAVIFGAFWFFRRRRNNVGIGYEHQVSSPTDGRREYELGVKHEYELNGEQRAELHTGNALERHELPGH